MSCTIDPGRDMDCQKKPDLFNQEFVFPVEPLIIDVSEDASPEMVCEYHKQNPHIYEAFKRVTLKAIAKGFKHWGGDAVFQIVRWESSTSAEDWDGFKLNNNHRGFYPRQFMTEFPEHRGFFRLRKSKFDEMFPHLKSLIEENKKPTR